MSAVLSLEQGEIVVIGLPCANDDCDNGALILKVPPPGEGDLAAVCSECGTPYDVRTTWMSDHTIGIAVHWAGKHADEDPPLVH